MINVLGKFGSETTQRTPKINWKRHHRSYNFGRIRSERAASILSNILLISFILVGCIFNSMVPIAIEVNTVDASVSYP